MKILIRSDSIVVEGYVNSIERNSKPLWSRLGRFIERIQKGAFFNALKRNDDVLLMLNHNRIIGSQKQGNLELSEDNIGLFARATVTDPEVIQDAMNGQLAGWSFGFYDVPGGVDTSYDNDSNLPLRKISDLDLREVSILNKQMTPAYDGTLIMVRSDEDAQFWGEAMTEDVEIVRSEEQPQQAEPEANIDYSIYEGWIAEMRGKTE